MSFVSSLVGGILGSSAASDAAKVEAEAAKKAQDLEQQKAQAALDFQNNVWSGTQAAEQPYQNLGSTSANSLAALLKQGFKAPTLAEAEQTPGFQFRLQQGTQAIDENAAATGSLMSGNTGVALQNYGQGLAESAYQQDYQNALNTYMSNYQSLMGGTGAGLTSTGQLGQFGQEAANTTANINMMTAQQQAQQINNAAAARASGYLGSANAWSNAAGGMAGGLMSFLPGGGGLSDLTGMANFAKSIGSFDMGNA